MACKFFRNLQKGVKNVAMIPLRDYALMHGKTEIAYHRLAQNGGFKTAKKIGKLWLVDESEPPPVDGRVQSGKYRGWRKRYPPREKVE